MFFLQHSGPGPSEWTARREGAGGRSLPLPPQCDAVCHHCGHQQVSMRWAGLVCTTDLHLHSWITHGPTIAVVREMLSVSNEFFYQVYTGSVLMRAVTMVSNHAQVMGISCPVTMETLLTLCNSPEARYVAVHHVCPPPPSLDA